MHSRVIAERKAKASARVAKALGIDESELRQHKDPRLNELFLMELLADRLAPEEEVEEEVEPELDEEDEEVQLEMELEVEPVEEPVEEVEVRQFESVNVEVEERLFEKFGTIEAMKEAPEEELVAVPGIGPVLAARLKRELDAKE